MPQNAFGGCGSLSAPHDPLAGSDPVWDGRSDGSRNEAGSGVWGSANEKGNLGGECGRPIVTNGDFAATIEDMKKYKDKTVTGTN